MDQQLGQVLADGSTGGAHHEVQDDLPALCGVAVQAADVARVPVGTQRASFVGPSSAPEATEQQQLQLHILLLLLLRGASGINTDSIHSGAGDGENCF